MVISTIANIANRDQISSYLAGDKKSPDFTGLSIDSLLDLNRILGTFTGQGRDRYATSVCIQLL